MWFMTKEKQNKDVTNRTSLLYVEKKLNWPIRQDMEYDEDKTRKQRD